MKVLYFAWLRERVGKGEEDVTPPPDIDTVASLMTWLATRSDRHAEALGDGSLIKAAVNQEYARPDHPITATDEIALFPPVTGG